MLLYQVERVCVVCGVSFWGKRTATKCSNTCRWRSDRMRRRGIAATEVVDICSFIVLRAEHGWSPAKLYPRLFRVLAALLRRAGEDPAELIELAAGGAPKPTTGRSTARTRSCGFCQVELWGTARSQYCSSACRAAAWRARRNRAEADAISKLCQKLSRNRTNQPLQTSLFRLLATDLRRRGWDLEQLLRTTPDFPVVDAALDPAPGGITGEAPRRIRWLLHREDEIDFVLSRVPLALAKSPTPHQLLGFYRRRIEQTLLPWATRELATEKQLEVDARIQAWLRRRREMSRRSR